MITIVDYGLGNLGSIQNMLKRIGAATTVTVDLQIINDATKIILPGVGSFDTAMTNINKSGLREVLDRKALIDRVPILGICLGMQLLTRSSEEGELAGLGWIPATTNRFPDAIGVKVPHMGWNLVHRSAPSKMTEGFEEETRFYFVHSYYVKVEDEAHSMLKTEYGVKFDSAIQNGNIYGVQFHPEKSHRFGMRLLANFVEL
jgi:glutamine amidotransferase